jgi:hypothetical protein
MEHFDERETQGRSPRKIKSAEQLNALIILILMGALSLIALFA